MNEPEDSQRHEGLNKDSTCNCLKDPFAELPPELRSTNRTWKTGFRQVTCPDCGLEYWTNAKSDFCMDCQKKGTQNSRSE